MRLLAFGLVALMTSTAHAQARETPPAGTPPAPEPPPGASPGPSQPAPPPAGGQLAPQREQQPPRAGETAGGGVQESPPPAQPGAGQRPAGPQPGAQGQPQGPQGQPQPGPAAPAPQPQGYPGQPPAPEYQAPPQYPRMALETPPPGPTGRGWLASDSGFVLSIDRAMGIGAWRYKAEVPGSSVEVENDGLSANLLTGNATILGANLVNYFAVPRVAFDGVLPGGVTLGGYLGYSASTAESTVRDSAFSQSSGRVSLHTVLFGARFGYILAPSDRFAVWFRGGLSVAFLKVELEEEFGDGRGKQLAVSLDPMLVFSPIDRIGILVGPAIDIGVTGSAEAETEVSSDTVESDEKLSNYGVAAGLAVFF